MSRGKNGDVRWPTSDGRLLDEIDDADEIDDPRTEDRRSNCRAKRESTVAARLWRGRANEGALQRPRNDYATPCGENGNEPLLHFDDATDLLFERESGHTLAKARLGVLIRRKGAHRSGAFHSFSFPARPYRWRISANLSLSNVSDSRNIWTRSLSLIRPVWTQIAARCSGPRTLVGTSS